MHCPKCGQQQVSEETRFCSRCGFLLTGVAQVVGNEGIVPSTNQTFFAGGSPRRRGVMQGVFIFLLSFLFVPLASILSIALNWQPVLPAISAILFFVGGLLRVVYALMFESGNAPLTHGSQAETIPSQMIVGNTNVGQLPHAQSIPASTYAPPPGTGMWRDTNDLLTPGTVTESTTKLLQKEQDQ